MRLSNFLDHVYVRERATSPDYRRQLRMSIKLFEGDHPGVGLAELSHDVLNQWAMCNPHDWAARTLRRRLNDVLAVWTYAHQVGFVDNPPDRHRVRRIPAPKLVPDAWTLTDLKAMLAATHRDEFNQYLRNGVQQGALLRATILVGFYSGLRCQDLWRLRRDALSPQGVAVPQVKKHGDEVLVIIPDWVIAEIDREYPTDVVRVFAWPGQLDGFRLLWRRMLRAAGLPDTPRDGLQKLRRSAASHGEAVRQGYGAQLVGHQPGSATTYKHYVDPRILRPAANLLPDLR